MTCSYLRPIESRDIVNRQEKDGDEKKEWPVFG